MTQPRRLEMNQVLRYAQGASVIDVVLDGYLNFHFITRAPDRPFDKKLMLEGGINAVAKVIGPDGPRTPVIALRTSPWKAGQESTPWHDEYDLDHGHVRYYGDHRPDTLGPVGSTRGNTWLLDAWRLHSSPDPDQRAAAPPLTIFRGIPTHTDRGRQVKGYVEFCGVGIIERLEYIVQRDPTSGRTFPNLVLDINVVRLDENDDLDWRWIDDRRDSALTARDTLTHAPESWQHWVREGRVALPGIRRRVLSSRVLSKADQLPPPGTPEETILDTIYRAFDARKHAFELLSARVAEVVLSEGGSRYTAGWLTRPGGDGGMDFVGRLDVGTPSATAPLVVLGQAKCINPTSTISPDQVARVVARLRRGWIGVFVTTGTFTRQAQVEIVDDEYPIVLIHGRTLANAVFKLAQQSFNGDVQSLLDDTLASYTDHVTYRRPEEILTSG